MSYQIYPRIKASFIAVLFLILVLVFIFVILNIFGTASMKLGFPPEYSVYFLFLSLLGGNVNIPVKKVISYEPVMPANGINNQSADYSALSPEIKRDTSITINLGGAIIPVLISVFLSTLVSLVDVVISIFVMTVIIHKIAKPVRGSGIVIHALLPPFLAVATTLIISPEEAPVIAYISGTIGCLVGIDLLNMKKFHALDMPVVSIGGAGTFDAIFLTGIISVLLA